MGSNTPLNSPATWKPNRAYMWRIEEQAMILRQRAGVGPLEPLDPRVLADKLKLQLVQPGAIAGLRAEVLQSITAMNAREWSGMSKVLPNGDLLIALNPNMTIERENVTIMEEVAHAHYGHRPVELSLLPSGLTRRRYDEAAEREAYWTAGATLLPSKAVGQAVYRGQSADEIAVAYSTSVELAEMRIKTLRLWRHYNPTQQPFRRAS